MNELFGLNTLGDNMATSSVSKYGSTEERGGLFSSRYSTIVLFSVFLVFMWYLTYQLLEFARNTARIYDFVYSEGSGSFFSSDLFASAVVWLVTLLVTIGVPTVVIVMTYALLKLRRPSEGYSDDYWTFDLVSTRFGNWFVKRRWAQFAFVLPNAIFFIAVAAFGLYGFGGLNDGNVDSALYNGATFLTWNIWWVGMVFSFVFLGRIWCTMCPLGAFGEWAHRTRFPVPQVTSVSFWVRMAIGFFFGVSAAMIAGITIGLFAGHTPYEIMGDPIEVIGSPALSGGILGFFDFLFYVASIPNSVIPLAWEVFVGGGVSNFIIGIIWFAGMLISFYIGMLLGYTLREYSYAAVIGSPIQQEEDPATPYPRRLATILLPTILFAVIMLFDFFVGVFINPLYTAVFVIVLIAGDLVLGVLYEKRAFCRYMCPLGGIIGTYAMVATIELRKKDLNICRKCKTKDCKKGRDEDIGLDAFGEEREFEWPSGYACPMGEFPMIMDRNLGCIMCMECFKACRNDNIALNLRTPLVDTYSPKKRELTESLLVSVITGITPALLLPSVPQVANVLNASNNFFAGFMDSRLAELVGLILLFSTVIIGGILTFMGALYFTKRFGKASNKRLKSTVDYYNTFAFTLIPIGFALHMCFWVPRMFDHLAQIVGIFADPFGGRFLGVPIYTPGTTELLFDNPVSYLIAVMYILNPLFLIGAHNWEIPALLPEDFTFAFRIVMILTGVAATVYAMVRSTHKHLDFEPKRFWKIITPMLVWLCAFTALSMWVAITWAI